MTGGVRTLRTLMNNGHGTAEPRPFSPPWWARNAHLQTIFGSVKIRALGRNRMMAHAGERIINAGNGVRLQGYSSVHNGSDPRGLVLLLHGWEGSAHSTYILHTGNYLFERGLNVFRLNLRDHGASHALNRGLFHGALLDEVVTAASNIAASAGTTDFYIVGFSLGGNFALRIAAHPSSRNIENLRHVVCISPLLDPLKSTVAVDRGPRIYRHYFMKKWKRSLKIKQDCFPGEYDFTAIRRLPTILDMTELLVRHYTDFPDYREYFNEYTIRHWDLTTVLRPVTIVASQDDPVIPPEDYHELRHNSMLSILMQPFGGHCGFLDPFPFGCWYERLLSDCIVTAGKMTVSHRARGS